MNGYGKSHSPLVPAKSPNKGGLDPSVNYGEPQTGTKGETPDTAKGEPTASDEGRDPTAEGMEGRGLAEGNLGEQNVSRALNRTGTPSALDRVGEVARRDKQVRFTTLLHHVYNPEMLRWAYFRLKREAAPGVDGMTWRAYGEQLETNIEDLSLRLRRGAYRAKPVRRVLIPKPDGRQRPLGVTALEDKVVQRALVEVLNQIYEADFLGFSYGFRPERSQHDALDALAVGITEKKVHWVGAADKAASLMGCKSPAVKCPCGRQAGPMHAKTTTHVLLGLSVTAATWPRPRRWERPGWHSKPGGLNGKE
jgi:hypothetical protein